MSACQVDQGPILPKSSPFLRGQMLIDFMMGKNHKEKNWQHHQKDGNQHQDGHDAIRTVPGVLWTRLRWKTSTNEPSNREKETQDEQAQTHWKHGLFLNNDMRCGWNRVHCMSSNCSSRWRRCLLAIVRWRIINLRQLLIISHQQKRKLKINWFRLTWFVLGQAWATRIFFFSWFFFNRQNTMWRVFVANTLRRNAGKSLYSSVCMTGTFVVFTASIFGSAFLFELVFDSTLDTLWDRINKGRQWKDIEHKYIQ